MYRDRTLPRLGLCKLCLKCAKYVQSLLYKCTQNQFTIQVYTKPVYCTSVHKTSLLYKCTQNQFTVQVYTKPIYCTSVTGQ